MKRVFFFGEDSHLARTLTDYLEQYPAEFDVVNSYHRSYPLTDPSARKFHSDRARVPEIDGTIEHVVEEVIATAEPDLIINCAGLVNSHKCYGNELDALGANYNIIRNIARAVGDQQSLGRDMRLVHFGTTASYLSHQIITESTPPARLLSSYGLTKLLGEQMAKRLVAPGSLLLLRPCFVYGGAHDNTSVIGEVIRRELTGDFSPLDVNMDLSTLKAPLFVDDFAVLAGALIRQEHSGHYILGAGDDYAVEYGDVVDELQANGISCRGVTWRADLETLGDHIADSSKAREATGLKYWPRYSLVGGLERAIEISRVWHHGQE